MHWMASGNIYESLKSIWPSQLCCVLKRGARRNPKGFLLKNKEKESYADFTQSN